MTLAQPTVAAPQRYSRTVIALEIDVKNGVAELALDSDGLEALLQQLAWLRDRETEHLDLFSSAWAGDVGQLSEQPRQLGGQVVHHLKIQFVTS